MKVLLAVSVIVVVLLGIIGGYTAFMSPEHHKYIVSDGYTGWVEVTFGQAESQPLEKEHRTYVYHIPANGKLKTSTPMKAGTMSVFYLGRDGKLTETGQYEETIHAISTRSHSTGYADGRREDSPTVVSFYLGSKEQWESEAEKVN
ncbi:DUF6843 domain-containing protein [Paenibacillus radicis (ex Xue et al. 2023)]|uniref:DUF6843 domain-containing protein n=1 Tax=Paenibacillus radicis (ex Xue et al. 2023) TaxID=2972489 RepID=A0ABT1YN18_9BACL|nr:hypothetical protein [Paenibacillus radicis (ex Xue et al. 2023)]MCR8634563.1 hypothetical protein [Paenibacillus radicis (ex Xue et al. 2023)]